MVGKTNVTEKDSENNSSQSFWSKAEIKKQEI